MVRQALRLLAPAMLAACPGVYGQAVDQSIVVQQQWAPDVDREHVDGELLSQQSPGDTKASADAKAAKAPSEPARDALKARKSAEDAQKSAERAQRSAAAAKRDSVRGGSGMVHSLPSESTPLPQPPTSRGVGEPLQAQGGIPDPCKRPDKPANCR